MKIDRTEIAPSGKPRLKIYLGEKEAEIMHGLIKGAFRHTPVMPETDGLYGYLRGMNQAFDQFYQSQKNEITTGEAKPANLTCPVIWFDGGTPCNDPMKGYGEGYGSFRINNQEIVRLKFGQAMSANTAEIRTATAAILEARKQWPEGEYLHLVGDSKIALKWVSRASNRHDKKASEKTSQGFREAITAMYEAAQPWTKIVTEWKPRALIAEVFGH